MGWDRESLIRGFGSQRMWRLWAAMGVIFAAQVVLLAIGADSDSGARRVVDLAMAGILATGTAICAFAAVMLLREGRRPDSQ